MTAISTPPQYAQTNLQLFNQLLDAGYSDADLSILVKAYDLALTLHAGRIRGSGKPFISHVVGTASILASFNYPVEIIAGGLLHAVYEQGDFGDKTTGFTLSKQQLVQQAVGKSIELHISTYDRFRPWRTVSFIETMSTRLPNLSFQERQVVAIRLANELEDQLDNSLHFCANWQKRAHFVQQSKPHLMAMSCELGLPELAEIIDHVFSQSIATELPTVLRRTTNASFTLVPTSFALKSKVHLQLFFRKLANKMRSRFSNLKAKLFTQT